MFAQYNPAPPRRDRGMWGSEGAVASSRGDGLPRGRRPIRLRFGSVVLVATLTERCEQSHFVTQGHRALHRSCGSVGDHKPPVSVRRSRATWLGDQGTMHVCCQENTLGFRFSLRRMAKLTSSEDRAWSSDACAARSQTPLRQV